MLLRKPWLFIIKYFNFIHIILFLILLTILNRSNLIYTMLNEYVKTTGYTYITSNINYFSYNIIFIIGLTVFVGLIFFVLFRIKQKPWLYYLSLSASYGLILILFLITDNIYNLLLYSLMDIRFIGFIRDLWFLGLFFQLLFVFLTLLRGIGFNLKKFNFVKDISELEINEEDDEEIEVNVELNSDLFQQKFNYYKRETIVFIKEKKYLLLLLLSILLVLISIMTFINRNVTHKINKVGDKINIKGNEFIVSETNYSNLDISGNKLKDGYYLIVKFSLKPTVNVEDKLDITKFSLLYNNQEYSPDTDIYNKLIDYGEGYNNQTKNDEQTYIIAFNIKDFSTKIAYLRYEKNIMANPKIYYRVKLFISENKTYNIKVKKNSEINMVLSPINSKIKINNFQTESQFNDKYEVCIKKSCLIQYDNIAVRNNNETILRLNYTIFYGASVAPDFIDKKMVFTELTNLEYVDSKNNKITKKPNVILGNQNNVVYFHESIDLQNSHFINLIFKVRNYKYNYRLK